MRFVRSVLLVAACMAAAVSHAALQWQGGIDQASKGAAAYITSPQGKVAGLVYGLDPGATGWKLNRQAGTLVQQPFPFQGGYAPLRPLSQYGINSPGKAAVIDVPTRIPVPGSSANLPARIIEPVDRSTLNRVVTKSASKFASLIPIIGTGFLIYDILKDLGFDFRDGEVVIPNGYPDASGQPVPGPLPPVQDMTPDVPYIDGSYVYVKKPGLSIHTQCHTKLTSPWQEYTTGQGLCNVYSPGCNTCSYSATVYRAPLASLSPVFIPATDDQIMSRVQTLPDSRVIDAVNDLPDHSNVVDVIAREIKDDSEDDRLMWPSPVGVTPPSTIVVGEPRTSTETLPDGSRRTTTITDTATITDDIVNFDRKTEVVTQDPTGQPTGTSQTVSPITNPVDPNTIPQTGEDIECGLPGHPPCKIDETGTPPPPPDDGQDKHTSILPNCLKQDWRSCFPELPDINWSFSLPSGCGPIPVPFGKYGFSEVNICPWQGMIHDLMSMLWAAAGLFGAIGILSGRRNSEAS